MNLRELVGWCSYAERKGYGYALRSDHFLPIPTGVVDSPECWTSLGAIAASTKTIRFGTMVTPIGYRNPALLAKMARTINLLSKRRFVFGLGAGWFSREYVAYGYEFPDISTRLEQFEEALGIIVPMVTGDRVSFEGKYFKAQVEALPRTRIHLIIGGKHPRIVRAAAKYADELNVYTRGHLGNEANPHWKSARGASTEGSAMDTIIRCKNVLDSASGDRNVMISNTGQLIIAEKKRGLSKYIGSWQRKLGLSGDPETGIERLRRGGTFCGTPDEVASQINVRRDLGVDRFYFEVADLRNERMADLLTETLKEI